jgi:hypothetical protein
MSTDLGKSNLFSGALLGLVLANLGLAPAGAWAGRPGLAETRGHDTYPHGFGCAALIIDLGGGPGLPRASLRSRRRSRPSMKASLPSGWPVVLSRAERAGGRRILAGGQEGGEIADPFEQRRRGDESVVPAGEVGAGARPWPIPRMGEEARPDRIHRNVSRRGDEVGLVHRDRGEAAPRKGGRSTRRGRL